MPRIAATLETVLAVQAPPQAVFSLFADLRRFAELMPDLENAEFKDDATVRWILHEKNSNGIRFKGDYTVRYHNNGTDQVSWTALEGNMGNSGEVVVTSDGRGGARVQYRETVEPDLPISPLMAKLLRPIIASELRKDVEQQLQRIKATLEAAPSLVA